MVARNTMTRQRVVRRLKRKNIVDARHLREAREIWESMVSIKAARIQADERILRELGYNPVKVNCLLADELIKNYEKTAIKNLTD